MIDSLVDRTMGPVQNALNDAGLTKEEVEEVLLVGGSTRIPLVRSTIESFFGKPVSSSVNPDEVVALGAAVQGGVFAGEVTDILLLDVTPLSLGLETMGGVMTRLIERNTTIPCSKSQIFTTAEDSQPAVDVKVLQGEREFAKDNKNLGTFKLDGIPPAPRGVPQIEVTFDIDANGIVSVRASDKATGKEQNITISGAGTISSDEIDRLVEEARSNEVADKERRKQVEDKNQLESLIFQSEKLMSENEDKLEATSKDTLTSAVEAARKVLDGEPNPEHVNEQIAALTTAMQAAAKTMYETAAQESAQPTDVDNDDVIDADFTECAS
tara:strand:- start:60 stop:1037 length:978 start_codon:yes stop_codon:yes gene_type:complete